MKANRVIRTVLCSVALALAASAAHATTILYGGPNTLVVGGTNTVTGAFQPQGGVPNTADLVRNQGGVGFSSGPFIDYWIFTVAPSATLTVSLIANALYSMNGWDGGFFNVTSATCTTQGTSCTGVLIGSELMDFTTSGSSVVGELTLSAGTYAIQFRGDSIGNPNQTIYSGSVSFLAPAIAVPEPATLALLGIGLIGLALTRRRKLE